MPAPYRDTMNHSSNRNGNIEKLCGLNEALSLQARNLLDAFHGAEFADERLETGSVFELHHQVA